MPLKKLKRAAGKVLGGAKKVVKKVVPKELAGIMQVAAPALDQPHLLFMQQVLLNNPVELTLLLLLQWLYLMQVQ